MDFMAELGAVIYYAIAFLFGVAIIFLVLLALPTWWNARGWRKWLTVSVALVGIAIMCFGLIMTFMNS